MIGDVIAGRYDLQEVVGTGGMSTVYRAHDRLLERTVALKVLHPQFGNETEHAQRFRHEARAVAQLSHPSIVTVIDRGESDGRQFIVFEYVDGENLKQLSGRRGPLPVRQALDLTLQTAAGLAFAHAHGIVHRDVKPQNVLVDADGRAQVTDFGIARSLDSELGMTLTGTVLGTSDYLSPEQASGQPVTAARTSTRSASSSSSCSPARCRSRVTTSSRWRCGTCTSRRRTCASAARTSRRGWPRRSSGRSRRTRAPLRLDGRVCG